MGRFGEEVERRIRRRLRARGRAEAERVVAWFESRLYRTEELPDDCQRIVSEAQVQEARRLFVEADRG